MNLCATGICSTPVHCKHVGYCADSRLHVVDLAPRSPAQPDAVELLRDAREVFTSGGKTHVGEDYVGDCPRCQIIARIDAFLRGGSGG